MKYQNSGLKSQNYLTYLKGLGSQKIDFFIPFFNSITIQKENAKVLNRLDEK